MLVHLCNVVWKASMSYTMEEANPDRSKEALESSLGNRFDLRGSIR